MQIIPMRSSSYLMVQLSPTWFYSKETKKSAQCLEYVLVHEIIHILEPKHNDRFFELLDKYMPTWRIHRDTLDKPPLVHVDWNY